jgi:hypothetical protein
MEWALFEMRAGDLARARELFTEGAALTPLHVQLVEAWALMEMRDGQVCVKPTSTGGACRGERGVKLVRCASDLDSAEPLQRILVVQRTDVPCIAVTRGGDRSHRRRRRASC